MVTAIHSILWKASLDFIPHRYSSFTVLLVEYLHTLLCSFFITISFLLKIFIASSLTFLIMLLISFTFSSEITSYFLDASNLVIGLRLLDIVSILFFILVCILETVDLISSVITDSFIKDLS